MATPNDPPVSNPQLERLRKMIEGRWITSFDLQFPQNPGFLPTAFLSCYTFEADSTFSLYQLRNKGGTFDMKLRSGTYTVEWHAETGLAGGDIAINSSDHLVLRYFMRRSDELHFIIDGANVPIPVAQGTMYKAELVEP